MNKKLFLKLGLLLLSLSLVACGPKDNISKTNSNKSNNETQSSVKEDIEQNIQSDVKQGLTEEEYYIIISEAWQKQKDYIDSIDDPKVKQSVQTAHSAAVFKSNELLLEYPEDSEAIDAALKRVLNGE